MSALTAGPSLTRTPDTLPTTTMASFANLPIFNNASSGTLSFVSMANSTRGTALSHSDIQVATVRVLSASPAISRPVASSHGGGSGGHHPESPLAKTVIGGTVTIMFEVCGGHFLEFLKIAKQTSNDSYLTIARRVTAHKGIVGTLDGFMPWGFTQCLVKGSVFAWGHATARKWLHNTPGMSDSTKEIISGGIGGFVQGVFMSPLLLLKTRVMTNPAFRTSGGIVETAVASGKLGAQLIAKEGLGSLTKGMGVFASKRFADWTTRYMYVELCAYLVREEGQTKLTTGQTVFAGLMGGTLSALTTVPIDVMVATIQDHSKSGQKVSIAQTIQAKMAAGGIGEIVRFSTRGLVARVAHVALTTLLMKSVTSMVYDALFR